MRIIVLGLIIASAATAAHAQSTNEQGGDAGARVCSRWSIKGAAIGMKVADLKKSEGKVVRKCLVDCPQHDKHEGVFHLYDRGFKMQNSTYLIAGPEGEIRRIQAILAHSAGVNPASPEALVAALSERWGPPLAPRQPVATIRVVSRIAAIGDYAQYATYWEDAECRIAVAVFDGTQWDKLLNSLVSQTVLVIQTFDEREESSSKAKEKAAEAVAP